MPDYKIVARCKKAVVAEKRFTVHDAPAVLTVHLKRFSPLGRKIGHFVYYDERLSLQSVMSEGQYGPSYSLYGVISHAGGGPNSGHYFAHVKAANGRWFEMNDDSASPQGRPPIDMKSAYILFYIRDKGQALDAAVHGHGARAVSAADATSGASTVTLAKHRASIVASMKKRRMPEEDEDVGVRVEKPFIGPLLPSPVINGTSARSPPTSQTSETKASAVVSVSAKRASPDPQAVSLRTKIAAVTSRTSSALTCLAQYGEGDDDEDGDSTTSSDSITEPKAASSDMGITTDGTTAPDPPTSSLPSESVSDASSSPNIPPSPSSCAVTPSSFYATVLMACSSASASTVADRTIDKKKRKSPESETEDEDNHRPSSQATRHTHSSFSSPSSKFSQAQKGGQHLFNRSHNNRHDQHRRKSLFGGGAVNPYNRAAGTNTLQYKYAKRRLHI